MQKWIEFFGHIKYKSQQVLCKTDGEIVSITLIELLQAISEEGIREEVIQLFRKIIANSTKSLRFLLKTLENTRDESTSSLILEILGGAASESLEITQTLIIILQSSKKFRHRLDASIYLWINSIENSDLKLNLAKLLRTVEDDLTIRLIAMGLWATSSENPKIIQSFINAKEINGSDLIVQQALDIAKEVFEGSINLFPVLTELLLSNRGEFQDAQISTSIEISQETALDENFSETLEEVEEGIDRLISIIQGNEKRVIVDKAIKALSEIAKVSNKGLEQLANLVHSGISNHVRIIACESLGNLSKDNEIALQFLIEISQTSEEDFLIFCQSVSS